MDRYSRWIVDQIDGHHPDASANKQSVVVLADACASLNSRGGLVFGMSMPPDLQGIEALYAKACAALAAWFPLLDSHEAEQLALRIRRQSLDVPIPPAVDAHVEPSLDGRDPELAALCERLHREREESLRRFGHVSDDVLARLLPIIIDKTIYPWPANMIGAQRLVRTPDSVLLVTDGLSNPWDPSLHADVPDWTFGFELALEVPLAAFEDASNAAIAASWAPRVLWAATDWVVAERADLVGRLQQFDVITHAIPPVAGLEHLVASNGCMGGLIGIPIGGDAVGTSVGHGSDPHQPGVKTWLLTVKLLTAEEYEWAMGVRDSSRARALAELFLARERHLSWPSRKSALGGLA